MKMKKIIAGVAASALAISALAVSTSAAKVTSSFKNCADDGNGNFQIFLVSESENLYNIDITKIATFEVTVSFDLQESWAGGAFITQCDAKSWNELGQYSSADDGKAWSNVKSGDTLTLDVSEAGFAADSTYVILAVQAYDAAVPVPVNIDNVVVKDAAGNVLANLAEGAAPAVTTPAATDAPTTDASGDNTTAAAGDVNQPTTDKNSPDTGVEGVAVVAGLAVIAAGAVVVAKKRK